MKTFISICNEAKFKGTLDFKNIYCRINFRATISSPKEYIRPVPWSRPKLKQFIGATDVWKVRLTKAGLIK